MSRTAPSKTKILITAVLVTIAGASVGIWTIVANSPSHKVQTVVNAAHQTTQITYHGQNGVSALALLKKHATIKVKHYSFGDFVTAIDGTAGNGPKYWIFYINGKKAEVGAAVYITKSTNTLSWKLQ